MTSNGSNPIRQKKDALRAQFREKRLTLSTEEKQRRDSAICKAATQLVSFRYAEYVLLYANTENEISVSAIAEYALERGKKIAFPRCNTEKHTMQYHFVSSLDELHPDSYGICEPSADAPIYDKEKYLGSAVCFVPGLVYDKAGYRLGYGKGFYDRYLSSFDGCRVGVVYSDFIVPAVPRGRFDTKVNILLTEKNVKVPSEN